MCQFYLDIKKKLEEKEQKTLKRTLFSIAPERGPFLMIDGKKYTNFASSDYLGLSFHPALIEQSITFAKRYGTGTGASRLVTGNSTIFEQLEEKIARFIGTETALFFATGYQLNSSIFRSLLSRDTTVFCDRYIHRSLIDGIQLSGAKMVRYRHQELDHLEELLEKTNAQTKWIVTESVFSVAGSVTNIGKLAEIAKKYNALSFVDEAHAIGVLGQEGRGLCYGFDIDCVMGTCSKALGGMGGFLGIKSLLKEWLINSCPGFIYSTAPSPSIVGQSIGAIDLLPALEEQRKQVLSLAEMLRLQLKKIGYTVLPGLSQIVAINMQSSQKAIALQTFLKEKGSIVIALRPPSVPDNMSSLRIGLSSVHDEQTIKILLEQLKEFIQV